ncbi:MAG: hypothetical protein EBZ08_11865 [Betaproteobacteria bacterium]|nr:hypothetical protein [Betaproteobacteria bacterium]
MVTSRCEVGFSKVEKAEGFAARTSSPLACGGLSTVPCERTMPPLAAAASANGAFANGAFSDCATKAGADSACNKTRLCCQRLCGVISRALACVNLRPLAGSECWIALSAA